jgi:hypothetical protein
MFEPDAEPEPNGVLAPIAARILMKILYGARMARYDLLRAISYLAGAVTRWTEQCDKDLHRLVAYINTTQKYVQVSWVGNAQSELYLQTYCDADFAGCPRTQRSTTGVVVIMKGSHTRFLLSAVSSRQVAVSHSTPEAEIIAAEHALRSETLPLMGLFDKIWERPVHVCIEEDNEAMIKIMKSGQSQKMRHLNRTHKVDLAFMIETIESDPFITVRYIGTTDQAADIYTKRFTDAAKWMQLLFMNNVVDKDKFYACRRYPVQGNDITI